MQKLQKSPPIIEFRNAKIKTLCHFSLAVLLWPAVPTFSKVILARFGADKAHAEYAIVPGDAHFQSLLRRRPTKGVGRALQRPLQAPPVNRKR